MANRSHFLATILFSRVLGLCYFAAFLSLYFQVLGLYGTLGVTPIHQTLNALEHGLGSSSHWLSPSVFWLRHDDSTLVASCITGIVASTLLTFGLLPKISAFVLWALHLSFLNADAVFLHFQWDSLLVEAGFLAVLCFPWATTLSVGRAPVKPIEASLLFQWLLFRLMFASGFVKLTSGDLHWRDLTALRYHFLTQPLPTPIGYYAAHAPNWVCTACTLGLFFVELVCPFLFFCRASLRHFAGTLTIVLQVLIILSGNYAFFNILTIGLCLFLFDDERLLWLFSKKARYLYESRRQEVRSLVPLSWSLAFFFFFAVGIGSIDIFGRLFGREYTPPPLQKMSALAAPFQLINSYGLFAVMTTERNEIVIEGSDDGKRWRPYVLPFKPQDLQHAPPIVAPYQPRIDWQMWFAALGTARENPWFITLLARIAQGSAPVLKLFSTNPFPDKPPEYLRALVYRYEFTSMSEREISGAWWHRTLIGSYIPPVHFESKNKAGD